jgi:hypothetical protein
MILDVYWIIMADENKKKEKKPLKQRLKCAIIVSVIMFSIGGFFFPILYRAIFSLPGFLLAGFLSVAIMWASIIIGHYFMEI